jgi:hypothetical protein
MFYIMLDAVAGKQLWRATKTQHLCRLGKRYRIRVRMSKSVIRESLKME